MQCSDDGCGLFLGASSPQRSGPTKGGCDLHGRVRGLRDLDRAGERGGGFVVPVLVEARRTQVGEGDQDRRMLGPMREHQSGDRATGQGNRLGGVTAAQRDVCRDAQRLPASGIASLLRGRRLQRFSGRGAGFIQPIRIQEDRDESHANLIAGERIEFARERVLEPLRSRLRVATSLRNGGAAKRNPQLQGSSIVGLRPGDGSLEGVGRVADAPRLQVRLPEADEGGSSFRFGLAFDRHAQPRRGLVGGPVLAHRSGDGVQGCQGFWMPGSERVVGKLQSSRGEPLCGVELADGCRGGRRVA